MCHCGGYTKVSDGKDDDGCCDCCCCKCLCNCIKKSCCCCCKCGMCVFKLLCSILSCVGVFLVLYLIMMICTDVYLGNATWRPCPFIYEGNDPRLDSDSIYCDHEGLPEDLKCSNGECDGIVYLYMYSTGGSGFLGATYFGLETEGAKIEINGEYIDAKLELYDTTNLSESRENKIAFKISASYDESKTDMVDVGPGNLDLCELKFVSIDAGFWDFMPIGPGTSFGTAETNTFICEDDGACVEMNE